MDAPRYPNPCRLRLRAAAAGLLLTLYHVAAVQAGPPDTDALREKYPPYRAALTALGDEQTQIAIESLKKLCTAEDPNLATDAAFFLGRALVSEERFEEALSLFTKVAGPLADKSTHVSEALYMQGLCEARLMKRKEAIATFESFLDKYKDAPERMRVDASRQASELKLVDDGSIRDVQQHMDYSRRRLALEDSGRDTRAKQEKIVMMLSKLIKEKDDKDSDQDQQGQQGGQSGKQAGRGSSRGSSGSPGSTPGGNHQASGDEVVRRLQNPGGRSQFGDIRDRERVERIYGALKARFPAQYKQLVEQYYKNLQEDQD